MADRECLERAMDLDSTVAGSLWEAAAIQVNYERPYVLTSGATSPLYVDCRRVISNVGARRLITAVAALKCERAELVFDTVAGGETAGIPFAAFLADTLSLPMVYVRKQARAHGTASRVEGTLRKGSRVLLFEDLITDGLSKVGFVEELRQAGGNVSDCLVILDRQGGGHRVLDEMGVRLHSLTTLEVALRVGTAMGRLTPEAAQSLTESETRQPRISDDKKRPVTSAT